MEKQTDLIELSSATDLVTEPEKLPVAHNSETNQLLSIIERVALSPDADIAKLEKMIDLQERILNKNAQAAFAADYARMKPLLPVVAKQHFNQQTKSHFAKLEDVNKAIDKILGEHGFATMTKVVAQNDKTVTVEATLLHCGGHKESTTVTIPVDDVGMAGSKNKTAVHGTGSSISYARRYAVCALLNVSTGDDNDGQKQESGGLTEFQKESLKTILMDCDSKAKDWFANTYGCIDDVPVRMFTVVESRLKAARDLAKKEAANGAV